MGITTEEMRGFIRYEESLANPTVKRVYVKEGLLYPVEAGPNREISRLAVDKRLTEIGLKMNDGHVFRFVIPTHQELTADSLAQGFIDLGERIRNHYSKDNTVCQGNRCNCDCDSERCRKGVES